MKKLILLAFPALIFTFVFSCLSFNATASAEQSEQYYAKISDSAYLYSRAIDTPQYQTFKLPVGYFVLLTGQADDNFYICQYADVMGYVKKKDVLPMEGTPENKYVDFATFTIKNEAGTYLRSSPSRTLDNVLKPQLTFLENRLYYYGTKQGEEIAPDLTSTWYYCKFQTESVKQFGYVYSDNCYKLSAIPQNDESFPVISTPLFASSAANKYSASELSGTAKTLIIIGVCLPCLAILYLLIKPTLISKTKKDTKVKQAKHKRRGDYFEFDDADLN